MLILELTTLSRVNLKIIVPKLVKEFCIFNGNRRFIIMFVRAHRWTVF